jgi:Fic family protein
VIDVTAKLHRINALKASLDTLHPQRKWDEDFLEKVKIAFTYNSNRIEGNTITYGQTIQLLRDLVTPKNATLGEFLDVINHQRVLDIVFADFKAQSLTEDRIKELHALLMKDRDQWADDGLYRPGKYKLFENMTVRSTGAIHTYMQPESVSKAMSELVGDSNEAMENSDIHIQRSHPLTIAARFHQVFLNEIHPFSDGNGRIARIFTNLILLKTGYPPIFIKEVNKDDYLNRFNQPEDAMLDFLADRLIESLEEKLAFITGLR